MMFLHAIALPRLPAMQTSARIADMLRFAQAGRRLWHGLN